MDPFTEIAKRFFHEFLELRASLEESGAVPVGEVVKLREKHERERQKWEKAVNELKRSAQDLVKDNKELSNEIERLNTENQSIRLQLNEAIMRSEHMRAKHRLPKDEPGQYPLTDLMTGRAYEMFQRDLERMMKEKPITKGDDD